MKYGFIGAGNMGGAILRRALSSGVIAKEDALVFGVNIEKLTRTGYELGVDTYTDVSSIVDDSDIILFGFKPQMFDDVMPEVKKSYIPSKVIISMAAGISIAYLEDHLGKDAKIIRIMPNTPAFLGCGMISVSRNGNVTDEELAQVVTLFESTGKVEVVDEELIHAVIGASGSSPAFTYMYIDALAKEAAANGINPDQALVFAAQAVLGAARMVLETGETPEQLRINVCSPGGTTIEGVNKLNELNFEEIVRAGARASIEKSKSWTK
ncbi:MAG: pyrroline-5-carboxylate reductase [Firmicutes bacterium]|nr:pyrroline-5-carboxylate reductase [Bacillota bacterium]MBQ3123501.1 pyrroline-5-carboxylate reductase [Bacillota bacterium]MBQ9973209.1 pyrroline-5-carboxylate reductase [Bacillota bacterium]